MSGFLSGIGQLSDAAKTPASANVAKMGSSTVDGTLNPNLGASVASTGGSDPLSTYVQMSAVNGAPTKPDAASGLSGAGLTGADPSAYAADNYAPSSWNPIAGHAAPASAPISGGPVGGISTPADAARAVLLKLGDQPTQADINSMVNWYGHEGGNWHNTATANPWNTTQPLDGSTAMNSVGVQAYKNWNDGINATVQTLRNGYYNDILAALASGNGLTGHLAGLGKWSGGAYYSA